MRNNGALSNHEIEVRDDQIIISLADCHGRILYVNDEFIAISGYAEEELLGQPHNMVRHPEMPQEVFADLWADLKAGRPWVGIIQNRAKNGDAYWVEAHVSPILEKGVITGYMSMRRKASPAQIEEARASYAELRGENPRGIVFRHGKVATRTLIPLLRAALADTPIHLKLLASSLFAALIVLAGFSYLLAAHLSKTLNDDARQSLRHEVGLVRSAVAARIENARLDVRDQAETLSSRIYHALGGAMNASPEALEKLSRRASADSDNPISTYLDKLQGVGTIFVRTPAGFKRLMTTATDENGMSAAGTLLAADHPALPELLAGGSYAGVARVFEREYMTNYTPIIDAKGVVVGATVIGVDLGKQLETLKNQLRGAKIGISGYYYIINVSPGPEYARMILHPYKEGQKVPMAQDESGKLLTEEMAKRRSGEIVYFWKNAEAGESEARKKLMMFDSLDDPQWVVAAGTTVDEFTALSNRVVWLVLTGGLMITLTILAIVLFLVRRLILKPLNRQVLPTFQAMSAGEFKTYLDISGNDEMANVVQGLECLRNRLAYESDRERSLARMRETARQEAEALSRSRAEFLSNMSHEIRTPLNAVIGLAYLLRQSKLEQRDMEYVKRIEGAGKLLLGVVNDVLDFSKIDAGRMQLEEAPFRLDDILDNLSNLVRYRIQEKKLVLEYVVAPDVPQALRGDALRLSQVLINLVGNAIKFTAEGNITVFVNARPGREGRVELEFRVQDSGIGMAKEEMANLFQAFSQADSSVTRKFGGTGLGLAICKRLVEMMGGSIWIDSRPQAGSTFTFRIMAGVEEAVPDIARTGYRVLVVDDNSLARSVLEQLLIKSGCTVRSVDSGSAALAALPAPESTTRPPYDFIMIDLNMPDMDGLTLASRIRAAWGAAIKLVMVTGENFNSSRYHDALGDFDNLMEKPVTAARITEVMAQIQNQQARPPAVEPPPQVNALSGLRVLVAEDVPTNQMIMRDLLESQGAQVRIADNGRLVLQTLAADGVDIDLILMDIQMPEMDGLEACRQIRAGQHHADIPIIALTAHALEDERQRANAAGMNDFLTKPIDPALMIAVIQRWGRREHPVATPPAAPAEADNGFPELPGINTAEGMHHVLNRRPLYEKILRDFHGRFGGETSRIRNALADNDIQQAARLAHSLKGTGATIGAGALSTVAAQLEQAINARSPEVPDCLEKFDRELSRVLAGIEAGLGL